MTIKIKYLNAKILIDTVQEAGEIARKILEVERLESKRKHDHSNKHNHSHNEEGGSPADLTGT